MKNRGTVNLWVEEIGDFPKIAERGKTLVGMYKMREE